MDSFRLPIAPEGAGHLPLQWQICAMRATALRYHGRYSQSRSVLWKEASRMATTYYHCCLPERKTIEKNSRLTLLYGRNAQDSLLSSTVIESLAKTLLVTWSEFLRLARLYFIPAYLAVMPMIIQRAMRDDA